MDIVIVFLSILSIALSSLNIQFIKVIRMLRVLRPLRMISRNEGLRIAVVSLLNAGPSILNALVIAFLFFILFAILTTTYLKGRLYMCLEQYVTADPSLIVTKWDCVNNGGDWINQVANFDNILTSLVCLFVCCSTEGWAAIMWTGVDAVDIDYNPL